MARRVVRVGRIWRSRRGVRVGGGQVWRARVRKGRGRVRCFVCLRKRAWRGVERGREVGEEGEGRRVERMVVKVGERWRWARIWKEAASGLNC